MYSGYVFRLILAASDETECMALGGSVSADENGETAMITENSDPIEASVMLRVVSTLSIPPLHHMAVRSLHSQFPSYSAAVKLLAIWAANHYFSGHLSHEAMELIVAHEYLQPSTLLPPASALAGFHRALGRIATHSWETDPLIVDLSHEGEAITTSDKIEITAKFQAIRASGKQGTHASQRDIALNVPMYIVSSCDKLIGFSSSLALKSPEKVIFSLIVSAAKASAQRVLSWVENDRALTEEQLAANLHNIMYSATAMAACNVYLHLNPALFNTEDVTQGPAFARLKVFSNISPLEASIGSLVVRYASCTVPL